jgi:hypothetical protein
MTEPTVHVVPEDLYVSGAAVDSHALDLSEADALADSRIESALPYLPGLAAAALAAKTTNWQATTAAFRERLTDHAIAFRTSAMNYLESDDASAQLIGAVGADGSCITFR